MSQIDSSRNSNSSPISDSCQIPSHANVVAELIDTGDFLTLSRRQPEKFADTITFSLENDVTVTIVAEGIICFEPPIASNKDVIYSCGIHGNETAPIEICEQLVTDILQQKTVPVHRLMVIFGNLPAMDIAERFVQENMNRLFSGEHSNLADGETLNTERQRAKCLEQAVADFYGAKLGATNIANNSNSHRQRYHYDLHTAIRDSKNEKFAVYPHLHGGFHSPEQVAFLGACGVKTILLSNAPTTTFSYFSSRQFGAHGFTVELGKVQPFGCNDMSRFAAATATLTAFVTDSTFTPPEFNAEDFLIYEINQVINRTQADFELMFADDAPNFSDFAKGVVLAKESGAEYIAQQDGEAIVFPNAKVAIGQRALLTVVPCQLTTAGS